MDYKCNVCSHEFDMPLTVGQEESETDICPKCHKDNFDLIPMDSSKIMGAFFENLNTIFIKSRYARKESAINDVLVTDHCLKNEANEIIGDIICVSAKLFSDYQQDIMTSIREKFDSLTDNIQQFHLIDKAKQLQLPADFISQLEDDFKIGK